MTRLVFALLLAFGFLAAPIASAQTTRSYIAYRGTYASGTNYAKGDMVSDGTGAKYLSLSSSNAGNTPSTSPLYWLPLSSGGSGSGGISITTQTNGTNNLSQTNLNHTNSTANAAGFSLSASNPSAGVVVYEVGVSNAATARTALGAASSTAILTLYATTCTLASTCSPPRSLSCQPGLGDGLNALAANTYLQTTCKNETGGTWTITAIRCVADSGSSTCNVTDCNASCLSSNGAGTPLLTGAITGTYSYANGTQSGTTTIGAGDALKITFVTDGTTKQIGIDIVGTY